MVYSWDAFEWNIILDVPEDGNDEEQNDERMHIDDSDIKSISVAQLL